MNFINPPGLIAQLYNPSATYKNYKYNGKELQETGMYDYGARMYMADIARWGQHDPLSEITLDPFGYVYNNPLSYNDPTGMEGENVATENGGDPPVKGASFGGAGYDGGVKSFGKGSDGNLDTEINQLNMNSKTSASSSSSSMSLGAFMGGGNGVAQMSFPKSQGSSQPFDPYANCGWCHDGPIKYIGGGGDVTGAWEILGMYLSSEDSNVKYVAVPLLVLKGQEDDALKVLAAEKGILSTGDALRIQNAATRINKPITVVGSRANGTAGARSTLDNTPRNIDIFKGKVNTSKPHITIKPRK